MEPTNWVGGAAAACGLGSAIELVSGLVMFHSPVACDPLASVPGSVQLNETIIGSGRQRGVRPTPGRREMRVNST
jgi:hypothetical protein